MSINKTIASGLPGIGSKGKKGDSGMDGLSIYFTDLDGEINRQVISDLIRNNLALISDTTSPNDRSYIKGDKFVDINSNIYEILLLPNNTYKSMGYKYIPNNIFEDSNYVNTFGYRKYNNTYLGDSKFLIDDIQSSYFSPNVYNIKAYNNSLGDFTKVNYTDIPSHNNLFLHETYINNLQGNGLSIVSHVNTDNTSTFRIGSVSNIEYYNDKYVTSNSNIDLVLDANRITLPKESFINKGGVDYSIITSKELNLGIFEFFDSNKNIEDVIDAYLNITDSEDGLYNLNVSRCDFLSFFTRDIDINDIRVNLKLYNKNIEISSFETINEYTIYDIPTDIDINNTIDINNIQDGKWHICLEIIDNNTGWFRVTDSFILSNNKLFIYPRLINSSLEKQDFIFKVSTPSLPYNIFEMVYTLDALSSITPKIPISLNGINNTELNDTKLSISCRLSGNRSDEIIFRDSTDVDYVTYGKLYNGYIYILCHLGYEANLSNFVYDKDNYKFLNSYSYSGKPNQDLRPLNLVSKYPYNNSINFNNDKSLTELFGYTQKNVHNKTVEIFIFNKSVLDIIPPSKLYYVNSNDANLNISNSSFIYSLNNVAPIGDITNTVDSYELSKFKYSINVNISSEYIYILLSDILSTEFKLHRDDAIGIKYNYRDAYRTLYKELDNYAYRIKNPFYGNTSLETTPKLFVSIKDNEFSSLLSNNKVEQGFISYGERSAFGTLPYVCLDVIISDNLVIEPLDLGFSDTIKYGYLTNNNTTLKYDKFSVGGIGYYNYVRNELYGEGVNSNINTAPCLMNGNLSSGLGFTVTPNITMYKSNFASIGIYRNVLDKIFSAINNPIINEHANINLNIFRGVDNTLIPKNILSETNKNKPIITFNDNRSFEMIHDTDVFNQYGTMNYTDSVSGNNFVTLPTVNNYGDEVNLIDGYVHINYATEIYVDTSDNFSISGANGIYENDENIMSDESYLNFFFYIDCYYDVDGATRKTTTQSDIRQIPITELGNYRQNNPLKHKDRKIIKLANPNSNITNFRYEVRVVCSVNQSYAKTKRTGVDFYYISRARYEFSLKFDNYNVDVSYLGNRGDSMNTPYIDIKNSDLDLEYKKIIQ